ncbi:TetR/AcrR family transcriptional regulator [Specibacter sp. RAF43]|uniref:TetR/AcrR family transcriptional regulator n=1 Tax=Specibacter sp. RAF43 TaxID=3233057 RepID=UPI003F950A86
MVETEAHVPGGPADRGSAPSLRSDAARNRASIVAAAAAVFAEQGIEAPLTDVARRAGVGIATLYRRFPDRDRLIDAVFAGKMGDYAGVADDALAMADPWTGFCWYVHTVCAMQSADHGFMNVLSTRFPSENAAALEAQRVRAFRGFNRLVALAKKTGRLRADFSDRDLPMLLMAHAGIVEATGNTVPELSARFVAYMIEAFSAGPDLRAALPNPPRASALQAAMARSGNCISDGAPTAGPD